ncbi:MAG: hypothetical protein Q9M30_00445, partial [Mariprofundaceae bacterium]|nr:hypothetical protein [Mariprofundaceae bacterium]
MHLKNKVQLTVTLPVMLLLTAFSIGAFLYLNNMMRNNAAQKGMLVVQMVETAMLSNVSEQGHSLNSGAMMQQFRTLPGLREVRLIRGEAVSRQFGPSHTDSAAIEDVEKQMLNSGKVSKDIENIAD